MSNKITLTYENGEFTVAINNSVVQCDKDMESALLKFNAVVKNNAIEKSNSWESIEQEVNKFNVDGIEVNSEFKTIAFGKMKYFYNTDKVFYIENSSMISLGGGYSLFSFIINKIVEKYLDNEESFLELCKVAMMNKAVFKAYEDIIMIASPKFNYGSIEYNFKSKKINKGTNSEEGSFEAFKKYAIETLK